MCNILEMKHTFSLKLATGIKISWRTCFSQTVTINKYTSLLIILTVRHKMVGNHVLITKYKFKLFDFFKYPSPIPKPLLFVSQYTVDSYE